VKAIVTSVAEKSVWVVGSESVIFGPGIGVGAGVAGSGVSLGKVAGASDEAAEAAIATDAEGVGTGFSRVQPAKAAARAMSIAVR
jgi:hypothetical protein